MGRSRVLALAALLAVGQAHNFLRSGQVSEADVAEALEAELDNSVASSRRLVSSKQVAMLEDMLRVTYRSLPKNAAGNLGHQAVRYVLHRFFVQRHGWFVRGLEPSNDTWSDANRTGVKEWVPDYLQGLLEQRLGARGTNLHELAVLAAALEDLVRKEAIGRLKLAYTIHGLSTEGDHPEEEVEDVVNTYFVMYLLSGNFSAHSLEELERKKSIFAKKFSAWKENKAWLDTILTRRFTPDRTGTLNFGAATAIVLDIGEEYYTYNDIECRSLKTALRNLESKKPGRVRLSTFYKTGLRGHWLFTEKEEYLRAIGALDEMDANSSYVVVPNYVTARTNCMEASGLYAICCRSDCEDLMGHLEREIGDSSARPERIAELVSNLPSETIEAPRDLSAELQRRLREVALAHGGRVPLHGRLFAQWMHHAYPLQCPYPHEAGKVNPQTPDEWMRETGHANTSASMQEMMQKVESDTCAGDETPELPWTQAEELLLQQPAVQSRAQLEPTAWRAFVAVAVGMAAFLVVDFWQALRDSSKANSPLDSACKREAFSDWWMVVPLTLLAVAAHLLSFLDGSAVLCTFCLSLVKARVGPLLPWRIFDGIAADVSYHSERV